MAAIFSLDTSSENIYSIPGGNNHNSYPHLARSWWAADDPSVSCCNWLACLSAAALLSLSSLDASDTATRFEWRSLSNCYRLEVGEWRWGEFTGGQCGEWGWRVRVYRWMDSEEKYTFYIVKIEVKSNRLAFDCNSVVILRVWKVYMQCLRNIVIQLDSRIF